MENSMELKDLWNVQGSEVPDEKIIIKKALQLKRKIRLHTSLGIISLMITMGVIAWVWFSFEFTFWSTKIGIVFVLIAIVLSMLNGLRTLVSPSSVKAAKSNRDYLEQMLIMQDQQRFTQTALMSVYFFLLSLGLVLYMYEPSSKMSSMAAIIAYALTIGWIAFNWFYWRPKIIKKQRAKMDDTIAKLRMLNAELETE